MAKYRQRLNRISQKALESLDTCWVKVGAVPTPEELKVIYANDTENPDYKTFMEKPHVGFIRMDKKKLNRRIDENLFL